MHYFIPRSQYNIRLLSLPIQYARTVCVRLREALCNPTDCRTPMLFPPGSSDKCRHIMAQGPNSLLCLPSVTEVVKKNIQPTKLKICIIWHCSNLLLLLKQVATNLVPSHKCIILPSKVAMGPTRLKTKVLTQHCKSTMLQYKFKNFFNKII